MIGPEMADKAPGLPLDPATLEEGDRLVIREHGPIATHIHFVRVTKRWKNKDPKFTVQICGSESVPTDHPSVVHKKIKTDDGREILRESCIPVTPRWDKIVHGNKTLSVKNGRFKLPFFRLPKDIYRYEEGRPIHRILTYDGI